MFQAFAPRLNALETAARADLVGLRATHAAERQVLDARLQETLERKGACSQLARAPQPDPALVEIREAKRSAVETLDVERQTAERAVRDCREVLDKAKAGHREQETRLQRLQQQRSELEQRRQACLLQQSPGEDTLLHFLRSHRSDWVFDIAKVVREDLLVRTDLDPELIDALPTLYGVGLDLGQVDAHLAADEEGLLRAIADLEEQQAAVDALRTQAERTLAECERERRQSDERLTLAGAELEKTKTRYASAREELKAAEHQVNRSLEAAAGRAKAQLVEAEQSVHALQADLRELDRRNGEAIKAREDQLAQDREALETKRQTTLAAHDSEQAERHRLHGEERNGIELELKHALGAAGVDTAALARLEQEITAVQTDIARIDLSRTEVSQWQLWERNDWPRRDEYACAAQAARALESAARADLTAEERRWSARTAEHDAALHHLDREHEQLERELAAIRKRLDGFRAYPPDPQVQAEPYDPGWT
ncbi:MAG: ATP-binding protein, partial [Sphingobacteriia bacterium]|nr:ATP-binding protein [Sphingobacteriia bacterium]